MKKKTLLMTVAIFIIAFSLVAQEKGTFTDSRDGKVYKTIKIGTQTWMAENLAFKADVGCWVYENNMGNISRYGYLYIWETAKLSCPAGWHLPTFDEYDILLSNYKGAGKAAYNALIIGGKSGFLAPLGGYRNDDGSFYFIDSHACFWCSSADDTGDAWYLDLGSFDKKEALLGMYTKNRSLSVRCIKD
jgi:uncharacterized protein (TIGR02145 family)